MLIFTIGDWIIPGFIFIPVVATTVFVTGLCLALWLDEKAENND